MQCFYDPIVCSLEFLAAVPILSHMGFLAARVGVEDTTFKAKAKDPQKLRGLGQRTTFRGQTLSRPRTEIFEAKGKDRGHKCVNFS